MCEKKTCINLNSQVILHIPQTSRIGAPPLDGLVQYPGHSSGVGFTLLQRCSQHILQPQPTGLESILLHPHSPIDTLILNILMTK